MPKAEISDTTAAPAPHLNGATYHPNRQLRRKKPLRMSRQRYERMEAIVDTLIRLLDEVDGEPDEEPSLGGSIPGYAVDGEPYFADCGTLYDECEDNHDEEPSLGWGSRTMQGGPHWLGNGEDLEDEFDGREEDDAGEENGDLEPSLGAENPGYVRWGESGDKRSYVRDAGIDQSSWLTIGDDRDLEGEDDNGEPSLGWTVSTKQEGSQWLGDCRLLDGEAGDDTGSRRSWRKPMLRPRAISAA